MTEGSTEDILDAIALAQGLPLTCSQYRASFINAYNIRASPVAQW